MDRCLASQQLPQLIRDVGSDGGEERLQGVSGLVPHLARDNAAVGHRLHVVAQRHQGSDGRAYVVPTDETQAYIDAFRAGQAFPSD